MSPWKERKNSSMSTEATTYFTTLNLKLRSNFLQYKDLSFILTVSDKRKEKKNEGVCCIIIASQLNQLYLIWLSDGKICNNILQSRGDSETVAS